MRSVHFHEKHPLFSLKYKIASFCHFLTVFFINILFVYISPTTSNETAFVIGCCKDQPSGLKRLKTGSVILILGGKYARAFNFQDIGPAGEDGIPHSNIRTQNTPTYTLSPSCPLATKYN